MRRAVILLSLVLLATATGRSFAAVTDGLILYAPFDNGSADDVAGGKTGNAGGTPDYRTSTGIIGTYVNLTNNTSDPETYLWWEDPTPATDNFSVQVWLRSPSFQNGQAANDPSFLSNKDWDSGGNPGWVVAMGSGPRLQWNFRAPPAGRADFDPSAANATVQDSAWHHLVVTHDRAGLAIFYVDGVNIGEVNIAAGAGDSLRPSDPGVFSLANDGTLAYDHGSGSTANGDFDEVAMWNRVLSPGEISRIYTAGRSGIGIRDVPEPTTAFVAEFTPSDGGAGVSPDAVLHAVILDASTQLNPASVKVYFDGTIVTHSLNGDNGTNTVTFAPAGLLAPLSTHSYRLEFSDNGTPAVSKTNQSTFTVGLYLNNLLPAPIALETFDSAPEGGLPVGWTATNATSGISAGLDLNNPESDSYLDWVVISSNRFAAVFDNRRLNVVLAATNGAVIKSLINGNLIYAESDNRGGNQVQILFSPDYDMSGQTNVYLSFHSIYEQNQDSSGSVEYSIDEGATWLPVVYMIDGPDIIRDGTGAVDAEATLNAARSDQAYGLPYGAWIGANITPDLAPYISARVDDDALESKRVEFFRLPQADKQPKVRLRFGQSGTGSWYFGLDDVGFYSITKVSPPYSVVTPASQVEAMGNDVTFAPSTIGVGPFTYQWQHNGVSISGKTNEVLVVENIQPGDGGSYSVQVGYLGGVTNSTVGTLTVIPASVAPVTGQWDFESFTLTATIGRDLEFGDDAVELETGFATSDFYSLPNLDNRPFPVMLFPGLPSGLTMNGYRMYHGIPANGGGTRVNQYTLVMDILYPSSSANQERALLQTNPNNADNRDIAIGADNGIGSSGAFQGQFSPDVWHRVAVAVDLSGPGPNPIMAKFIDGVKVGTQVLGEGKDGRWSLEPASSATPWALLFADDTLDVQLGYASSIQVRAGRLSDAQIAHMGGPSASKIPGGIAVTRTSATAVQIRWTGGVPLESADQINGPWSPVTGTSPLTVNIGAAGKFYRPKL